MTAEVIDELRRLLEEPDGDLAERFSVNRRFHRTIYEASGNAVLTRILDSLHDRATRYRLILVRSHEDAEIAAAEHRTMLEALVQRDGKTLARLTHAHLVAANATINAHLANEG
jgi:GntR family transcriptional repressor for pyruvate dehydrogenase complex